MHVKPPVGVCQDKSTKKPVVAAVPERSYKVIAASTEAEMAVDSEDTSVARAVLGSGLSNCQGATQRTEEDGGASRSEEGSRYTTGVVIGGLKEASGVLRLRAGGAKGRREVSEDDWDSGESETEEEDELEEEGESEEEGDLKDRGESKEASERGSEVSSRGEYMDGFTAGSKAGGQPNQVEAHTEDFEGKGPESPGLRDETPPKTPRAGEDEGEAVFSPEQLSQALSEIEAEMTPPPGSIIKPSPRKPAAKRRLSMDVCDSGEEAATRDAGKVRHSNDKI